MLKETERPAWDEIGAHAALPLLEWAVEYQSPVFLLCESRKTGICRHTADGYGGNVEFAGFPPLQVEEILQMGYSYILPLFTRW